MHLTQRGMSAAGQIGDEPRSIGTHGGQCGAQDIHDGSRVTPVGIEIRIEDAHVHPDRRRVREERLQQVLQFVRPKATASGGIDSRHDLGIEDIHVEVDPETIQIRASEVREQGRCCRSWPRLP